MVMILSITHHWPPGGQKATSWSRMGDLHVRAANGSMHVKRKVGFSPFMLAVAPCSRDARTCSAEWWTTERGVGETAGHRHGVRPMICSSNMVGKAKKNGCRASLECTVCASVRARPPAYLAGGVLSCLSGLHWEWEERGEWARGIC
jgi:hypothetical protein